MQFTDTEHTVVSRGFTAVAVIISSQRAVLLPALPAETSCMFGISGCLGSSPKALGAADSFLILTHEFILAVRRGALQVGVRVGLVCLGVKRDGPVTMGQAEMQKVRSTGSLYWPQSGITQEIC